MNQQPIEKQHLRSDGILDVHSIFYTIQGEGPLAGHPAIFIRLAGCNLQCPMCDTDYTSDRRMVGPKGLIELVRAVHPQQNLVVITGGEPFRQNLTPAVEELLSEGYAVQIETNGSLYLSGFPYEEVTLVCSPKSGSLSKALVGHRGAINAFKYVLSASNMTLLDGLPTTALNHPASPEVARPPVDFTGRVYLQPADEKDEILNRRNLEMAVESCLRFGYILCLQLHKIIGLE